MKLRRSADAKRRAASGDCELSLSYRALLLRKLRQERDRLLCAGVMRVKEQNAPLLYRLAMSAANRPAKRRFVIFEGVRFQIEFGWHEYIRDPEFPSQTLVAVNGL